MADEALSLKFYTACFDGTLDEVQRIIQESPDLVRAAARQAARRDARFRFGCDEKPRRVSTRVLERRGSQQHRPPAGGAAAAAVGIVRGRRLVVIPAPPAASSIVRRRVAPPPQLWASSVGDSSW